MNRRDTKKNKIGDTDIGTDNELQPLQGFSEGFSSNGVNQKFGKSVPAVNLNAYRDTTRLQNEYDASECGNFIPQMRKPKTPCDLERAA